MKALKAEIDALAKELTAKEQELKQLEEDTDAFMRQLRADQLNKCEQNWDAVKNKLDQLEQVLKEFFGLHQVFDDELKEAAKKTDEP